jgi:hypothetical protein
MAGPSLPLQGCWFFIPQRRSASALFIRLLPSLPCVSIGFTAAFTPSLIATWLFAPYDSWTSVHSLTDKLSSTSISTSISSPLFLSFLRALQVQCHQQANKQKIATNSNTSATLSAWTGTPRRLSCNSWYHKYNPEVRLRGTIKCTHPRRNVAKHSVINLLHPFYRSATSRCRYFSGISPVDSFDLVPPPEQFSPDVPRNLAAISSKQPTAIILSITGPWTAALDPFCNIFRSFRINPSICRSLGL